MSNRIKKTAQQLTANDIVHTVPSIRQIPSQNKVKGPSGTDNDLARARSKSLNTSKNLSAKDLEHVVPSVSPRNKNDVRGSTAESPLLTARTTKRTPLTSSDIVHTVPLLRDRSRSNKHEYTTQKKDGNSLFIPQPARHHREPAGSGSETANNAPSHDGLVTKPKEPIISQENKTPEEILARGPVAEKAYRNALKNGKVPVYHGRLLIIGPDRAGKTSLRKSLCGLQFDQEEQSTVGVDASVCGLDIDHVTNNWELKEDVNILSKEMLPRMLARELMSPTNSERRESEEDDYESIEKVKQSHQGSAGAAASKQEKHDKSSRPEISISKSTVPDEVADLLIKFLQEKHFEITPEEKEIIISIWDFAGQHLYYAAHQVFLSNRAIYLLVYNLSKDMDAQAEPCVRQGVMDILLDNRNDETNLESVLSWLVSVHTICQTDTNADENTGLYQRPPVFIVGTHADKPFEDAKEMEKKLKIGILEKSYQNHVLKPYFIVNNADSSNDEGIIKLHQKILEVLKGEPYMGEVVPIRWHHFEKAVRSIVKDKQTYFLQLEEVHNIARKVCLIEDQHELNVMLNFYHDLGVIIKHGSTVVLDAHWLIDLFKRLITIRNYDEQNPLYTKHWKEMEKSGKLHMELVDYVFGHELKCGQIREDILKMMEHFGLIASFTQDGKESCFFVPSQLSSPPSDLAKEVMEQNSSKKNPCPLFIHFPDGFVPHGLHTRLVCELISWCKIEPCLYRDASVHFLDMAPQIVLTVVCRKRTIKLLIDSCSSTATSLLRAKAIEVREFVEATLVRLSKLCPWYRCLRYEICVSCSSCEKRPCSQHHSTLCHAEPCLHLLPAVKDQPFLCKKNHGQARWPEIPGYYLWCPEMNCTLNLSNNEKRWIVVGITLNTVVIPPLRDYLGPCIERHYEFLKTGHSIDKQSHAKHLKNDGTATLNYGSINNNEAVKKAANYDYSVMSCVDLAKLYLKPFMAKFTGFDHTCDASAVLGVLISASVFPPLVQSLSKQVKDEVRNKWGHCDIEEWDQAKFDDCFTTMVELVKSLSLRSDDRKALTDKLHEWKTQGVQLLEQGTDSEDQMKLLIDKVGDLSNNLSSLVDGDKQQAIVNKRLENVQKAFNESLKNVKEDVKALKKRMSFLESLLRPRLTSSQTSAETESIIV